MTELTEWPIQTLQPPLSVRLAFPRPCSRMTTNRRTIRAINIRKTCTSLPPCLRTGIFLRGGASQGTNDDENTERSLPGTELAVLRNGPIRWRRVTEEWDRQNSTGTKTAVRRRRRWRRRGTVHRGLSLERPSFLTEESHDGVARTVCVVTRYTTSRFSCTARNVTRENPTRRARAKRVEKPRYDDINTHRRPPPPLGHGQYGVPLGLAAGKLTGWQEWNARLGLVRRPPRDVTVRKLARPSVTHYSTAQTTPSCTVDTLSIVPRHYPDNPDRVARLFTVPHLRFEQELQETHMIYYYLCSSRIISFIWNVCNARQKWLAV